VSTTIVLFGSFSTYTLVPPDGTDNSNKRVVDVDALLGGSLDALGAKALGEVAALVRLNLALVLEVALVGNNDDGEVVLVLYAEDLLVEGRNLLKRAARGDRVDEEESFTWRCYYGVSASLYCGALTRPHVLLPHGTVLFLASRVEDIEEGDLVINDALLAVRVLDGRVVLVDELGC
jgi:hypothetical protein